MKGIIHLVWLMAEICDICHIRKPEICAVKQTEKYALVPMWVCPVCAEKLKVGEEYE